MEFVQVAGSLLYIEPVGQQRGKRLEGLLKDQSGELTLTWFGGINWIQKSLKPGSRYLVYGRLNFYNGLPQIVHPEMELLPEKTVAAEGEAGILSGKKFLEPVYPSTEKLSAKWLGGRHIGKLTAALLPLITERDIPEILPENILRQLSLVSRFQAFQQIHFPANEIEYEAAVNRLKFEELFLAQLRLKMIQSRRHLHSAGIRFEKVGEYFNDFYKNHLPFALTGAQKKVIKEIRTDTAGGRQMNRLLQGDVGSGKTIVALLCMLLAIDNGYQACFMAPTEILAKQHFNTISTLLSKMNLDVQLLTGSTRAAERKKILESLKRGELKIITGTHALLEDDVQFSKLGIVIIDEQHRFGVAQRARLWEKGRPQPHVLVMTATPIPRTLAMTLYGDLDYSVIDELPPGRQPITTVHRYETKRNQVMDFLRSEIDQGRQAYIVFPLIEESEKLNYENLMKGYENIKAYFPEPKYRISMVHGRQSSKQKDTNMKRFAEHDTQIMVSTTVIEVGVDVPNASIMVVESAEKFGLSQLHQLRGRVGRGADKSYCILLTGKNTGQDALERIRIMTGTNNGFIIAEKDLQLRGPGDIEGTRQSGLLNFKLASLVKDQAMIETAGRLATQLLDLDPDLNSAENLQLKIWLASEKGKTAWSKIS
jgi:ATP-dependent DNA helicase RecG